MKVCFVGVGSIATRHIRNLWEILEGKVQIDVLRSGKGQPLKEEIREYISDCYDDAQKLQSDYDAIFITNPTAKHYEALKQLAGKTKAFFIEKPVFDDADQDIKALGLSEDTLCYVAAPLRYHSVIDYVKKQIDLSGVFSVRCISSSYLPDWRPGTDYRDTYSAHKALGGGVAIDLIHEWDYITYLMGMPSEVHKFLGKVSDLEIDSEDTAIYIARYPDKFVELHLDYFGRALLRKMELFMKEDTIECDLLSYKVRWLHSGKEVELPQDRDTFQKAELRYFLKMLKGDAVNENDIVHACQVMRLAE